MKPATKPVATVRLDRASERTAFNPPSWKRIQAIFVARNREFYRDSAGLIWNILMPVMMIVAFAFIFGSGSQTLLKVGLLGDDAAPISSAAGRGIDDFLSIETIQFVPITEQDPGVAKVARHQLDLLLDTRTSSTAPVRYWVNPESANGSIAERLLLGAFASAPVATSASGLPARPQATEMPLRETASGEALSYADWAVPGVLAMNLMFSSLWGVGWVVVRYRKNGVLRRLKATPLTPLEFLIAQILSRLIVVLASSLVVYTGAMLLLDFPMRGSYLALILIYVAGALNMISLGLIIAARLRTEELADGLLNLMSWPMLLLSGVWFSMEGTSAAAQTLSHLMPLTYLVESARAVMIDGADLIAIAPQLALLLAMAAILITIAARLFRWE
ncbi:ABC transporter permease [Lamprobacter modestohalophilus]|uniref:ABC transporter permease n=1 Tax=Lamprobacter modestohalophilus TaxID=1064514 RepID=A0A9X0W5T8_9GAMM|nr:ABC transporter permease [Lamprobacter modestohalophilus]MBK1616863.1 ABC transporter permease [Lamprobacter modestohalophilus]